MRRLLIAVTILASATLLFSSSGCVRCHEFAPGAKLVKAGGGSFQVAPQKSGGPDSRPSS